MWPLWGCAVPYTCPLSLIPIFFSGHGVVCEMGCGSKTFRKVSTEFLNVPGSEAGWIPDLQSFQGPEGEGTCRFGWNSYEEKGKISL